MSRSGMTSPASFSVVVAGLTHHRFAGVWATLKIWLARSRGRALLASFDERMLKDIGLTHADARAETAKHFWQG